MAEQFDLLSLQQSSKQIRNPFGFDFHYTWGGQPYVFKGTGKYNGKWQVLLGPIAELTANHLFQLIRNQYHDEQTEPMKLEGKYDAARKYRVPLATEDTIWSLITGEEHLPRKKKGKDAAVEQKANLATLKNVLSDVKADGKQARSTGVNQVANVSGLIERAQKEIGKKSVGVGESDHAGGTAQLTGEDVPDNGVDENRVLDAGELGASVVPAADVLAGLNDEETPDENADENTDDDAGANAPDPETKVNKDKKDGPADAASFGDLDNLDNE